MTAPVRPTRIVVAAALALTLALAAGACGNDSSTGRPAGSATSTAEGSSVKIALFRFQPASLEVLVGTTVTWRNDDAILHTVTAGVPGQPTGVFDEALPDKGAVASVTFDKPGTFTYFCDRHPEAMRAEITVVP